jgi:hypothetical protein
LIEEQFDAFARSKFPLFVLAFDLFGAAAEPQFLLEAL